MGKLIGEGRETTASKLALRGCGGEHRVLEQPQEACFTITITGHKKRNIDRKQKYTEVLFGVAFVYIIVCYQNNSQLQVS